MNWPEPDSVRTWRAPLRRDAAEVSTLATTALVAVGFAVAPTEAGLEATGPARTGTKQSALLALGRVDLAVRDGAVVVRTDLSGGRPLVRFARWFGAGLGFGLAAFFALLGAVGGTTASALFDLGAWGAAGLGMAVPALVIGLAWLPLGWWMASRIEAEHEAAARALVASAAGSPPEQVTAG